MLVSIFFFQFFFFNGTWCLWGLSHSWFLFFNILHLALLKLPKLTFFFYDTLGYLPAMVTPPWAWLFVSPSNDLPSLFQFSHSVFHIAYTHMHTRMHARTHAHTFPDDFRMGISEIVALVAIIAPQSILLYMWTYF